MTVWHHEDQTKPIQTILPDPHSLMKHTSIIERHCLEHNMKKVVDPSRDGCLRDETNGLKPFWYECS